MAELKMSQYLENNAIFYVDGKAESDKDRCKRMYIWQQMTKALSRYSYWYKRMYVGDVTNLWLRVQTMTDEPVMKLAHNARRKLQNYRKSEKTSF